MRAATRPMAMPSTVDDAKITLSIEASRSPLFSSTSPWNADAPGTMITTDGTDRMILGSRNIVAATQASSPTASVPAAAAAWGGTSAPISSSRIGLAINAIVAAARATSGGELKTTANP